MILKRFYEERIAQASFLLGCPASGEAIVIDPQRDVEIYLTAAAEHDLKIRHIFETHLHADFVSGHKELAERAGAKIYIGPHGGARFARVEVGDGYQLRVGKLLIEVLHTPGHTPESICMVVTDEEKSDKPWAVFTGDTLFIGDVGRPDLSQSHTPAELAGLLYDSLHNKLLKLPDDVLVYPAHSAGSLCGRNMRAERSSTIATERLTNYALQISRRDEFVLSTKVGYGIPGYDDWTGPVIAAGVDAALGRLRTDRIDVVHLHSCPLDVLERGEVVAALQATVTAGKVRVAAYSGDNAPLKEVFDEFRADLGEMGAEEEDLETHYNLGIAFREMGLLEEAISEFQKVAKANEKGKAFRYAMQCCTLLGLCFMEKGQPNIAAIWYERALRTPSLDA